VLTVNFFKADILLKIEILAADTNTVLWANDPNFTKEHFVSNTYRNIWGRDVISIYRNILAWRDYLIPEDKDKVYAAIKKRNTPINPQHTENYCIALPDGTKQWIIDRSFTINDSINKPLLTAGVALPVSESQLMGEPNIIVSDFIDSIIIQYYHLITQAELFGYSKESTSSIKKTSMLSKREIEVLKLILSGLTANQIAEKIFVSRRTVEAHTNAIKQKLGCDSKSDIISKAIEKNYLHITID
jgi:DNA-binding CsgD family transcriptional regulator